MKRKGTTKAVWALAALFFVQLFLHSGLIVDRWVRNYGPTSKEGVLAGGAPFSPDQILLELFGFREFLAGILWVRADGFFDEGNYDAVLPIIRLCTILDPHQLDIFATGMWHIAYNFTDQDERSDRRYVPTALALGKEGCVQNPNSNEIYYETGWIWYHKIDDDYDKAVSYFQQAVEKQDILPARRNVLAQAYQRDNQVQQALEYFYKLKAEADDRLKANPSQGAKQESETLEANIDTLIVRMVQRGWLAQQRGDYAKGDYDTKPAFDVGFSARVTIEDPKVLRVQGTWNVLPVGTRIRIVLRDADFPTHRLAEMDWDAQKEVDLEPMKKYTFLQDSAFVKNRKFDKRIDMSKDPTMYPLLSKNYILEFYYNPRSAPAHIQDKFGWNGEGMTDSHFLNTQIRPGTRCVYAALSLTKDQITRRGQWSFEGETPVVSTANFDPAKALQADNSVITVPTTLRGAQQ
jgi:hypothetical protein